MTRRGAIGKRGVCLQDACAVRPNHRGLPIVTAMNTEALS